MNFEPFVYELVFSDRYIFDMFAKQSNINDIHGIISMLVERGNDKYQTLDYAWIYLAVKMLENFNEN